MPEMMNSQAVPSEGRLPLAFIDGALEGHLTRIQLEGVLEAIGAGLPQEGTAPVVLDCSRMEGYDLDARHAFVEWNKRWRDHISRVAIVTSNRLYHVVIGAMSLASGQAMKGFAEREEAEAWAKGLPN